MNTPVDLAVRVYVTPEGGWKPRPRSGTLARAGRASPWALVFDVETWNPSGRLDETYQSPLIVGWRVLYGPRTVVEGLAHADGLDPEGVALLRRYTRRHEADVAPGCSRRLQMMSLARWREEVLYDFVVRRGARLVAFNAPFDLSRLALWWRPSGDGFTFSLWGGPSSDEQRAEHKRGAWDDGVSHPPLYDRHLNRFAAFLRWQGTKPATHPGPIIDTRTVAYALTGQDLSLERACERSGIEARKIECRFGVLDDALVDHVRADVAATAALDLRLRDACTFGDASFDPARLYSPASLAGGLLDAMGVGPLAPRYDSAASVVDLDALHAAAMAALHGARAEARIVRTRVPVVHADATAGYASRAANLGLWDLLTAERLVARDATDEARALLDAPDLADRLYDPATSRAVGVMLCLVEPHGNTLFHRARYPDDAEGRDRLALNPLDLGGRVSWWAWGDVAAATLLDGHAPKVLRAIRVEAEGKAEGLRSIKLPSGRVFDPYRDDLFVTPVEERQRLRRRGDPRAGGLKVAVNALAHGLASRLDKLPERKHARRCVVWEPETLAPIDGVRLHRLERPGPDFFPAVAACVTAAERLVLAMVEHAVADAGGVIAAMDTDAVQIVATRDGGLVPCHGGPERLDDGQAAVRALSFARVEAILRRFDALNPFDPRVVPHTFRIELDSLDEPRFAYALSAKRREIEDDQGRIVWASEHALGGLYLDPERGRLPDGRRTHVLGAWEYLRDPEHTEPPAWASLPAVVARAASTPRIAERLGLRPFSFVLQAVRVAFGGSGHGGALVAPFTAEPAEWPDAAWEHDGLRVTPTFVAWPWDAPPGVPAMKSFAAVLDHHLGAREPTHVAPPRDDGTERQLGLLARRAVTAAGAPRLIGKETVQLDEQLDATDPADARPAEIARCAGCDTVLRAREVWWCRACKNGHDASWRARRLILREPRTCAHPGCNEPVHAPRAHYCAAHATPAARQARRRGRARRRSRRQERMRT